jgi:hypothetical protein
MGLLEVADALWQEAFRSLHPLDGKSPAREDLERCSRCLTAGLKLVLPTPIEVRFRLLLSRLLHCHSTDHLEAYEQSRKCHQLIHSVILVGRLGLYCHSFLFILLIHMLGRGEEIVRCH